MVGRKSADSSTPDLTRALRGRKVYLVEGSRGREGSMDHDGLHWTEAELQSISCDFSASLLPLLLSLSLSKTQIANHICFQLKYIFVSNC